MTITITANNKTITIDVPENGQEVKVSAPENITAPAPVVELPPQKKEWAPPPEAGQVWGCSKSRIMLFNSPDFAELMDSPIGHYLLRYRWLVIPTDKSFKGTVYNPLEIKSLFENAVNIMLLDCDGHLIAKIRKPHEKTAEFDLKILTDYGAEKLRCLGAKPETYYELWRTHHTSLCPRLAENLLAA